MSLWYVIKNHLTLSPTIFVLHCSSFRPFPQCHPFWEPTSDSSMDTFYLLTSFYFPLFVYIINRYILYLFFFLNSSTSAKNNSTRARAFLFMVPTVWSPLFRVESGTQEVLSKCFLNRWWQVWPIDMCCLWAKCTFRVVKLGLLCFLLSSVTSQLFLYQPL